MIKIQRVQVLLDLTVQGDKVYLDSIKTVAIKGITVIEKPHHSLFQRSINYIAYYILKKKKSDLSSAISFFSKNLFERFLSCYHLVD